uniref:Uncharacterized protein n=1 Tax=Anguilla anguilla TaxID=7936 RepID=A0A0E9S4K3_ANGAN
MALDILVKISEGGGVVGCGTKTETATENRAFHSLFRQAEQTEMRE